MSTTFILHGGFSSENKNEDNSAFYSEILKDAPENVKALLVLFAKDEDRIPLAIPKLTREFDRVKGEKNITVETANEKDLITQIKFSDVIYFSGGSSLKLLEVLGNYPDLKESIEGKIIAGESAGANVWGEYFYSPRADKVSEGLGILPIKINPHYKLEYKGKLDHVGAGLEELLLSEYEYKVFVI